MTVPARDVMLRIERPIERPEAADEEESPCPPPERELLLSMFRVLKDLHLYCEESGRGELVAEVVDALSMCTADFTALATRLRDRRPDERLPLVPPLARVQTSPLAARALGGGGGGDASVLSSPASLSSSPRSLRERGDEARQLESLDMEQLCGALLVVCCCCTCFVTCPFVCACRQSSDAVAGFLCNDKNGLVLEGDRPRTQRLLCLRLTHPASFD